MQKIIDKLIILEKAGESKKILLKSARAIYKLNNEVLPYL